MTNSKNDMTDWIFKVEDTFKLTDNFIDKYKGKQPNWGPVGYVVYKRTYARTIPDENNRTEEWWETCKRVVEGCYTVQLNHCKHLKLPWNAHKAQKSAQEMYSLMFEFKFLPPGRGLWAMGTDLVYKKGSAALNNCFSYETEFITSDGIKKLGDCANSNQTILSENGEWITAPIRNFGEQRLYKITLSNGTGALKIIHATADHKWYCTDRRKDYRNQKYSEFTTIDLRPGVHKLKMNFANRPSNNMTDCPFSIARGFCYGDGTNTGENRNANIVNICGDKIKDVSKYFGLCEQHQSDNILKCNPIPKEWKTLIPLHESKTTLYSWLKGYFAADGSCQKSGMCNITSFDKNAIEHVRSICSIVGIGTHQIRSENKISNLNNKECVCYSITLDRRHLNRDFFILEKHKMNFVDDTKKNTNQWKVIDVEETDRVEDVYCATVPVKGNFTLADNILTSNCAVVSTDEIGYEFSEPFIWLMDMSLFGVGVAFDTKGAGKVKIQEPKYTDEPYIVEDSKEGWCELIKVILDSYVGKSKYPNKIDYSMIRPIGSPIRTFGGTAPGPDPLIRCVSEVKTVLNKNVNEMITSTTIVDVMNILGKCVVSGGCRRCLPEDTEIHTINGLIKIKDIKIGELVKTSDGWKKVTDKVHQGKQKLLNIKTKLGDFKCTHKHRMKVFNGIDSFEWKRANEMVPGDRMVFYNKELNFGKIQESDNFEYVKPEHSTTCVNISIPKYDEDFAWFMGYFHGDGCVRFPEENKGSIQISVHPDHIDIKNKVIFNLKKFSVNVSEKGPWENNNVLNIRVSSKQLALYLSNFKTSNKSINIPEWIKKSPPSIIKAYICGLHDADGSSKTRPLNLASSIYPEFLYQVQNLLATIGIASCIKKCRDEIENWKSLYVCNIKGTKHLEKLYNAFNLYSLKSNDNRKTNRSGNEFGFPNTFFEGKTNYKSFPIGNQITESRLDILDNKIRYTTPIEILEIVDENEIDETYDISVEDNHEFVCGPGLISHNTAELSLGDPNDTEYLKLKDFNKHPEELLNHRWASNNSVSAYIGMDYTKLANQTAINGEPGYIYVENMRKYGRLKDGINLKDTKVVNTNPCGEQSLENFELCCLCELFPSLHETVEEFYNTVKYAYLYAKTVTLIPTHCERTNQVMLRNRRIGLSMTGIIDAIAKFGRHNFFHEFCDKGYNRVCDLDTKYSQWFCVPESIKKTTTKPSGTVSLLPGVSPGIHYPHSKYYIRRIEIQKNSPLVGPLEKVGFKAIQSVYKTESYIFEFPIKTNNFIKGKYDVSIWEQMENAYMMQYYWSDNNISQTVTVKPEELHLIKDVLEIFEDRLKAVSFLPLQEHNYEQAPYEEIDETMYKEMALKITDIPDFNEKNTHDEETEEKFCNSESCELNLERLKQTE